MPRNWAQKVSICFLSATSSQQKTVNRKQKNSYNESTNRWFRSV